MDREVPTTAEGVIEEILFKENDVVPIWTVIARRRVSANAAVSNNQPSTPAQPQYEEARLVEEVPYQPTATLKSNDTEKSAIRIYSPLVLIIA